MPTTTRSPASPEAARRLWRLTVSATLSGDYDPLEDELNLLAVQPARQQCRRLAHRGAPCRCTLGSVDEHGVMRQDGLIAHSALSAAHETIFTRWARDGRRGGRSGIRQWLQSGAAEPFLGFDVRALRGGRPTDVHRRWNVDRSMPARADVERRLAGSDLDAVVGEIRLLAIPDEDWDFLGAELPHRIYTHLPPTLRSIQDPRLWLDGLFADATQPAPIEIDLVRVLRWIEWSARTGHRERDTETERRLVELAATVANAVDQVLALRCPQLYDLLLARPRAQTRTAGVIHPDIETQDLEVDEEVPSDLDPIDVGDLGMCDV